MPSALTWTLQLHPPDQPLLGVFPKTPILASDFPNVLDKTIYGEFVPIIYGVHDSRGSSDDGMVPCPYVDRINFRYLVAQGWVTVDRVYSDAGGELALEDAADYTVSHRTINGRLYTMIDWDSPGLADDVTVQADVTGYEDQGDGGGSTITGVDVIAHLLTNFVYGDYQGGTWAATSSNIHSASFTTCQSFLTDMGWEQVSRRFGGESQTEVTAAIDDLCHDLQVYAFFTNDSKLAILPDDHRTTTLWYDDRLVRYDSDEVGEDGSLRIEYDRDSIVSRLSVQYIYDSASDKFVQTIEVRDVSITEENADTFPMPWSHASLA
jgi:hypothetical protein